MAYEFTRRHFFFGPLLAGAIPVAGFGSVPSLRHLGYKSPNEKLNIASIGAGGKRRATSRAAPRKISWRFATWTNSVRRASSKRYAKAPKYKDSQSAAREHAWRFAHPMPAVRSAVLRTAESLYEAVAQALGILRGYGLRPHVEPQPAVTSATRTSQRGRDEFRWSCRGSLARFRCKKYCRWDHAIPRGGYRVEAGDS